MEYKTQLGMQIKEGKWTTAIQLDEGINFLKNKMASEGKGYQIDEAELDKETGVGVVITEEMVEEAIEAAFKENAAKIAENHAEIESSDANLKATIEKSKAKLEEEIAANEVKLLENRAMIDTNIGKLAQKKVAIESNRAKIGEQEAEKIEALEKVTDLLVKTIAFKHHKK